MAEPEVNFLGEEKIGYLGIEAGVEEKDVCKLLFFGVFVVIAGVGW